MTVTAEKRGAVLRVMLLALMMVVAAVASLNVALPEIARDTGATQTELQWIVDAYALVFAALLLPAGAIGDRYGRKGILIAGLALFALASAAVLFVDSPGALIAIRGILGVAAAMVMPVTLSIITTVFPPHERGKAVGTWVGVAAGGAILGLLVSGLLLEWFAWQSVFVLNIVLAAAALAGTLAVVPRSKDENPSRLDAMGALLSVAALAALVYGIIEGPTQGWGDALTLATIGGGIAGLAAFVVWELRRREPMLDPRHFLRRGFGGGSLSLAVQFFSAFGFLFLALPYLQLVHGFSPLRASAALLPMALLVIPLARVAPQIAARFGQRNVGALGLLFMASGFGVMSFLEPTSSYWHFLGGLLPLGAGMALAGAPATTAIVASLPPEKQGVASAVNDVSRELGGALGIAVLGSVLNDVYREGVAAPAASLPPAAAEQVTASFPAAEQVAARLGSDGAALAALAERAFVDGLSTALAVSALVLVLGAVVVWFRGADRAASRAASGVPLGQPS
jgi:EmrB/QacA subfamily drug resistance transporter